MKTSLASFWFGIQELVGGNPFAIYEYTGFSGATYSDMDQYSSDFREMVRAAVARTQRELGNNARTVFVLGASTDGFGKGYEILQEMRGSGEISNAIVAGMASNEVVKYHLEGAENGWGDVISPHQDIVFLMQTYSDSDGNRSWELKTFPNGPSETVRLLTVASEEGGAAVSRMEVIEGGAQAFREAVEFLLEASGVSTAGVLELVLNVGYEAGKPKKDKGYRAASQLALLINEAPALVPKIVSVKVAVAGQPNQTMSVAQFFETEQGQKLLSDYGNFETLGRQAADAVSTSSEGDGLEIAKARERYFEALGRTRADALAVVNESANRGRERSGAARRMRSNPSHPVQDSPEGLLYLRQEVEKGEAQMDRANICMRLLGNVGGKN
ncbi:MAG: hypothetical protein EA369_09570 [Bradymonadales bacterium]|nr:MAG: hypothetical protein EA369_09570 [Bradymonadales bacterium]